MRNHKHPEAQRNLDAIDKFSIAYLICVKHFMGDALRLFEKYDQ